jgi:hypothetical protein
MFIFVVLFVIAETVRLLFKQKQFKNNSTQTYPRFFWDNSTQTEFKDLYPSFFDNISDDISTIGKTDEEILDKMLLVATTSSEESFSVISDYY